MGNEVTQEHRDAEHVCISEALTERDEARGRLALIHEAYWLAIADMPHSDECAIDSCHHERACDCVCSCWRSAADKVENPDEALALCSRNRDLEDERDALRELLSRARLYVEHDLPPAPNHQCGPESGGCDGECVDYAHGCRLLMEIDTAIRSGSRE